MGTFEMAKAMKDDQVYLFISKRYSVAQWTKFVQENQNLMPRIVHASCQGPDDVASLHFTLENIPEIQRVYLSSNNFVTENFHTFVQRVKAKYPHFAIMVGKKEGSIPRNVAPNEPTAARNYVTGNKKARVVKIEIPVAFEAGENIDFEGNFFHFNFIKIIKALNFVLDPMCPGTYGCLNF